MQTSSSDPTNQEILEAINTWSTRLEGRMDSIERRMATKEELAQVRAEMSTKEDLGKLRSEMIDYIARQNMELKGDLIVFMRGGDRKLFALIELMVEKKLLSRPEANKVTKLEPFPMPL